VSYASGAPIPTASTVRFVWWKIRRTFSLNPTLEGQVTARYIIDLANKHKVEVLQIARGVPLGSELEFADSTTLSVAFAERSKLN